jgi:hypothetical protein
MRYRHFAPDVLLLIASFDWKEFAAGHKRLGIVCGETEDNAH